MALGNLEACFFEELQAASFTELGSLAQMSAVGAQPKDCNNVSPKSQLEHEVQCLCEVTARPKEHSVQKRRRLRRDVNEKAVV
jgi:hypothetical protein